MKSQQITVPTDVFGDLDLREGDVIEGTAGEGVVQVRIVSRRSDTKAGRESDRPTNEQLLALSEKHAPPPSFFEEGEERPW